MVEGGHEDESNGGAEDVVAFQDSVDYYSVLNVTQEATPEELRAAFRKLAVTFHPDRHHDEALILEASEKFKLIKTAYETLMDKEKRELYDKFGASGIEFANWQMEKKYSNAEELKEEFEKWKRKQDLLKEESNKTVLKGGMAVNVSAVDLFEDFPSTPQITVISLKQSVEIPLTETVGGRLAGSVQQDRGIGEANLSLELWKDLGHNARVFTAVSTTGEHTLWQIGTWKRLSSLSAGSITALWHPVGTGLTISCDRILTKNLTGMVTFSAGITQNCSIGIIRSMEDARLTTDLKVEANDLLISSSYAKSITKHSRLKVYGSYSLYSGRAAVGLGGERKVSKNNTVGMSVALEARGITISAIFERAGQKLSLPVFVTDDISWRKMAAAVVIPAACTVLAQIFVIEPYQNRRKQKRIDELRQRNKTFLEQAKKNSDADIKLMMEYVTRQRENEEKKHGLLIIQAWYGALLELQEKDYLDTDRVIDATVPIQYMVEDSQLHLHAVTKANLRGFYDVAPGQEKYLYIRYLFNDKLHEVTVKDTEAVALPRKQDAQ